ncbi:Uncharacterised protein [Vibrio cholerae]|nr:Uncharacterised protein [Vibrio cholerae]CSB86237.1 Uncharacterised protein [Vibrio cholerae]CSD22439.1 Uncharacterised protein [Vibrio cholerae]
MRVFLLQGKRAGGRGGKHRRMVIIDHSRKVFDVVQRVFTRFVVKTVGDQGHTATFFAIKQTHAYVHRVHHSHKVFTELRVVVVHVAAVEISHLPLVERLAGAVLFKPTAERAVRIFG